jgi:glycerophosphoryl diester phosphodiesterase
VVSAHFSYAERPLNFGHRGAPTEAPENTLASFQRAREAGADGVELDVMLCADGEVVVCHDFRVDRTTDGRGRVIELTLAQLSALDAGVWFGARFAGERIPTLCQVAQWAGHDMLLNIELKSPSLRSDGLEDRVIAVVREQRLEPRVVLSSFNPFILRRAKRVAPEIHTGLLYARDLPAFLRRAWLRPWARPDALHPEYRLVTAAYLAWARRKGYRVNTWAPMDIQDMQRLVAQQVDMIITDRPDLLAKLLRKGPPL